MTNGIAHVSFRGGSLFLPARTPYDRQILVEYVTDGVRTAAPLQVLLNDRRWMVWRSESLMSCIRCGGSQPSYATDNGRTPYCLPCAFAIDPDAEVQPSSCLSGHQQVA
jgi:hypothetical protein